MTKPEGSMDYGTSAYPPGQQAITIASTSTGPNDTVSTPLVSPSGLFALFILTPLAVLLIRGVGSARAGHDERAVHLLLAAVAFCGAGIALLLVGAR